MALTNYKILEEHALEDLEKSVRNKIKDGWVPQGGVIVINNMPTALVIYVQAMVKNE